MIYKLTDIEIEEISGVDKAANRKTFLIQKGEGTVTAEEQIEQKAREIVAKGAGMTYEQAYAQVLKFNPELYTRSLTEKPKTSVVTKSDQTLRDVIEERIDQIVAEEKAANPKTTYYAALSEGLKKRGLDDLYGWYVDPVSNLPTQAAVAKLAKKYGVAEVYISKKLK